MINNAVSPQEPLTNAKRQPMNSGQSIEIKGTVVSGLAKASHFTQLDWVQRECLSKFGFRPYPGTLNLKLAGPDLSKWAEIKSACGVDFNPPSGGFCSSKGFKVKIGNLLGAVILPEVEGYPQDVVEIMSCVHLKDSLGLKDGDRLSVVFFAP